ncbi:F-box protein [Vitis vinifera]|uniref:F-box protein n=1 Tax=Vitis vinifera TaxID=29760 RepID=A0A438IPU5_VITVI|nr:F-box protein [Vitis vinifera]
MQSGADKSLVNMEKEEPTDLISSLPQEIIRCIVSLLPLKDAARTSVLSGLWRSLWAPTRVNFDFDFDRVTSHEASEDRRLLDNGGWMGYFGYKGGPQLLWWGHTTWVRDFRLKLDVGPPCPVHKISEASCFASLKNLHFESVSFLAEDIVPALFSNCLLLESLRFVKCRDLRSIDVEAASSFQSFEMVDCPNVASITLSAPNLKSFRYGGILPSIQINKGSNLVDSILDFIQSPANYEFDTEQLISLLADLKEVEILTLSGWLLQCLCLAGVIFNKLDFQFNKLKELWWKGSSMDREKRDSMSCFLKITPSLERLCIDIDPQLRSIPTPIFHQYWHEPHLWMDYATVKSNASLLKHLSMVSISGFTRKLDEVILMDLLFEKAVILQRMIVKSRENNCWRVVKIPKSQMHQAWRRQWKFSVASQENKYLYGFIEDDCSHPSPKHGEMCPSEPAKADVQKLPKANGGFSFKQISLISSIAYQFGRSRPQDFRSLLLDFQFNKLKELWWKGPSMDRETRDSMSCFLNITPSLERLFIDIEPQLQSISTPIFHQYWHEPHLWMDYATVKFNASPLKHLSIVSIAGLEGSCSPKDDCKRE